jgi:hypothetical protein
MTAVAALFPLVAGYIVLVKRKLLADFLLSLRPCTSAGWRR